MSRALHVGGERAIRPGTISVADDPRGGPETVLTPAEELGLSGLGLASRVRKTFDAIPEPELVALIGRMRDEALRRHLIYMREGEVEPIRIMPCPITALHGQIAYIHSVSLTILEALKRLPDLYLTDPAVRDLLQLEPEEEAWFRECWGPAQRELDPVFGRLDAVVDFISPMWKDSLRYVEPNLTGIGGLHLTPTCEAILADVVLPALSARDGRLHLELCQDIRELLMQEMLDHLETLGRPERNVCFVEPKYAKTGPDEQEDLARYFHERHGLRVMHADPTELTLLDGEVFYEGHRVDLAYRDYEVRDLIALGRDGVNVEPLRALLKQNRIISSMTAEFDQKSAWEVLTDPPLAQKYFHADERQVFRRHIPWTRVLADRCTTLPDGQVGDLLPYLRRERETLVLKPNRAYGGAGVVLGHLLEASDWDAALDSALADTQRWVVQQLVSIPVSAFPVVDPDGSVEIEPFHVVLGFAPSKYGLAILGRASQKQVVNVAQRGGMCAIMIGHPPARLVGPGPHA